MSASPYSLDAWRRFKNGSDYSDRKPQAECLADVSADAEMDDGIVLGCWNGERFVSWEKWLAAIPLDRAPDSEPPAVELGTDCVHAVGDSATEGRTQSPATIRRRANSAPEQLTLLESVDRRTFGNNG